MYAPPCQNNDKYLLNISHSIQKLHFLLLNCKKYQIYWILDIRSPATHLTVIFVTWSMYHANCKRRLKQEMRISISMKTHENTMCIKVHFISTMFVNQNDLEFHNMGSTIIILSAFIIKNIQQLEKVYSLSESSSLSSDDIEFPFSFLVNKLQQVTSSISLAMVYINYEGQIYSGARAEQGLSEEYEHLIIIKL